MKWHYRRGQERHGPFSAAELKRLARSGALRPDDVLLREGTPKQVLAGAVLGLFPKLPVAEVVRPRPSPWSGLPGWAWAVLLAAGIAAPAVAIASYARWTEPAAIPATLPPPPLPIPLPTQPQASPQLVSVRPAPRPEPELLVWPRLVPRERTGPPAYPRTLAEIRAVLAKLEQPIKDLSPRDADQLAALRRLQAYRYLAGVPYQNLVLDPELTRASQAGAELLQKAGVLSHEPDNPGLPEEVYQYGRRATRSSNLGRDCASLVQAIDGFMDDSDPSNIDRIGHRRRCLNPSLRQTGFGRTADFMAMWAHDTTQPAVPEHDFVPYPASGYMPLHLFPSHAAWSVSLNPARIRGDGDIRASIYPVDAEWRKSAEPLPLNYHRVDYEDFGSGCCVIFRPPATAVVAGKKFLVVVDGLRAPRGGPIEAIEFGVEFVEIHPTDGRE